MRMDEAISVLKKMVPKKAKMVEGRLVGGFDAWESKEGIAIQLAIKAIKQAAAYDEGLKIVCDDKGNWKSYDDTYDVTIHCKDAQEEARVKEILKTCQTWIPVTERVPEKGNGKYLVTIKYEHLSGYNVCIRIRGYCAGTKEWYRITEEEYLETGHITAWMPLPEPYRLEEQEDEID